MRRVAVLLLVPFLLGGCRSTVERAFGEIFIRAVASAVIVHGTVAIVQHEAEESARKRGEQRGLEATDDADIAKRWRAAKRAYGK